MKRMLLAAFVLASTLGIGHAQTQTYHFGEGQTQMPGGSAARHRADRTAREPAASPSACRSQAPPSAPREADPQRDLYAHMTRRPLRDAVHGTVMNDR